MELPASLLVYCASLQATGHHERCTHQQPNHDGSRIGVSSPERNVEQGIEYSRRTTVAVGTKEVVDVVAPGHSAKH
jgi:hypothetical protein